MVRCRKSAPGTKIGVEDGYELTLGRPQTVLQGAGLETTAVGPVNQRDINSKAPPAPDRIVSYDAGLIC